MQNEKTTNDDVFFVPSDFRQDFFELNPDLKSNDDACDWWVLFFALIFVLIGWFGSGLLIQLLKSL